MDLDSLPRNASSLKFSKHNAHIMSLCLTMHVNLQLSLRKTAQALHDLYGIRISHQQVANNARTAAVVIKPFVDHYDYPKSSVFTAAETYIKVRGIKGYIWFIMDAASRSIFQGQKSRLSAMSALKLSRERPRLSSEVREAVRRRWWD